MFFNLLTAPKAVLKKLVVVASLFAMIGLSGNAHAIRVMVSGDGTVADQIFANGDLTGSVDRPASITAEEAAANYDVIVISYRSGGIDWDTFLLPFLASGGGVVLEGYNRTSTATPLVTSRAESYVCPDLSLCYIPNSTTFGPAPLTVNAVNGLTDGLTNDFTVSFGYFDSWDASLSPFLTVDAEGLGTITYALQGEVDAGRLILSHLAANEYGANPGTAQQENSYTLLKNSIEWASASTNAPNPDLRFYPNVVGLNLTEANAALAARDLVVSNIFYSPSVWYLPETVRIQDPQAGTGGFVGDSIVLIALPANDGAAVTVPNVIGMTYTEADTTLATVNMQRDTIVLSGYNSNVPAGQIITQYPKAGETSNEGWAVSVLMSSGPAVDRVPALSLMTQAEAEAEVVASGFLVGNVSFQNHPTMPAGTVIDQAPFRGSVLAAGNNVDIVVSAGPAGVTLVTVPDVTGQTQADAEAAVVAAGLSPAVSTAASDTVAAGLVINQTPAGGVEASEGSVVGIVVSSGPAPAVILVPNVTGQAQADAEASITAAGLTVGNVTTASSSTVAAGNVISQTPAAGTEAAAGDVVDLLVSTGPALVTVPSVTGQTQANAEAAIVAANLSVGNITTASSNTVATGNVISQTPAGGTDVTEGTSVDLLVSTGPDLIVVPNVVGLSYSTAVATIENAGLTVGNVSTVTTRRSCGRVNSQNPTGGSSVAAGTEVDLVVTRTRTCNPL